MIGKNRIYSLQTGRNGLPEISYSLGLKIFNEYKFTISIALPTGNVCLKKSLYLNKFKIYDGGKLFFIICDKQINVKYAFDVLLKYSITKISTRITHLETLKSSYKKLVSAA